MSPTSTSPGRIDGRDSPQHGQFVPPARLVDDGGLDAGDAGAAGEAVQGQVLEVGGVPGGDVHHQVVAAGDEVGGAHFRDGQQVFHEAVHAGPLVLGEFDEEQGFQAHAQGPGIHLGVGAGEHSVGPQAPEAIVDAGRRQAHPRGDGLVGEPGVVLQKAKDFGVDSVEGHGGEAFPDKFR
jgi:hypothetical protein